jgi:hypothetical protein
MPSKYCLMLRSAQRARLEARTASLQLIFAASINFLTASFAGATEKEEFRLTIPQTLLLRADEVIE